MFASVPRPRPLTAVGDHGVAAESGAATLRDVSPTISVIGAGCPAVAAGAVVTHDVAPYTIVAGVPARPIGSEVATSITNFSTIYPFSSGFGWAPLVIKVPATSTFGAGSNRD